MSALSRHAALVTHFPPHVFDLMIELEVFSQAIGAQRRAPGFLTQSYMVILIASIQFILFHACNQVILWRVNPIEVSIGLMTDGGTYEYMTEQCQQCHNSPMNGDGTISY